MPATADELLAFAQRYFAREGSAIVNSPCHFRADLELLILNNRPPDGTLRAHLFDCPLCFRQYREAVESRHTVRPSPFGAKTSIKWLCTIAAGVFVASFGVAWWYTPRKSQVEISIATGQTAAQRTAKHADQPRRAVAEIPLFIDLDFFSPTRAVVDQDTQTPSIRLPRALLHLTLELPEGRIAGTYTVRILDARSNPVRSATVNSPDGKTLELRLDTTDLPNSVRRLSLTHTQQSPLDFPVVLVESR